VGEQKRYTAATTITKEEHDWILKKVRDGKALNKSDVVRTALRTYMTQEGNKDVDRER
jgi:Arc/MetJ-type ribon-helix-helix transcriptional regulator